MKTLYKDKLLNLAATMAQSLGFNNAKKGKLQSTNVQDAIDELAMRDEMISDAWNSSTTYIVGSYCISDNKLWKCLVQNSNNKPSSSNSNWSLSSVSNSLTTLNSTIEKKKLTISNEVWNGFFVYDKKNKTVEFTFNSINVANGSLLMRFQGNETDFIPANNKTFYGISNSNSSLNRFQIEFKNNGDVQMDCLDINVNVQRGTISGIYSTI